MLFEEKIMFLPLQFYVTLLSKKFSEASLKISFIWLNILFCKEYLNRFHVTLHFLNFPY